MLPRATPRPERTPRRDVVVLTCHERRFAVASRHIVEVARVESYVPVPSGSPAKLGVVFHREQVLPLVDVAPLLGITRLRPVPVPALCVVARTNLGDVALAVDGVIGFDPSAGAPTADIPVLDLEHLGSGLVKERHGESPAR
jgi:chemotaxis signal transduction protein